MQHPDEGMIHTWLDGELSPEESASMKSHLATCQQCAAAVAEARGLMAGASRIVSALDIVPSGVLPIARPHARSWYSSAQFRAVAAVLIVASASLLVFRKGDQKQPVVVSNQSSAGANSPAPAPVMRAPAVATAKVKEASPAQPVLDAAARRDALSRTGPKDELAVGRTKAASGSDIAAEPQRAGFAKTMEQAKASDAVISSAVITGVAEAAARLLRVDSTKTPRQSFYATAGGATLILTELASPDFANSGVSGMAPTADRKTMAAPRNAPTATRVMAPPAAPVPDPMIPFPSGAAAQKASKPTINTITWFDVTGSRRYVLSGPVSVAELEAVKAQLQKPK